MALFLERGPPQLAAELARTVAALEQAIEAQDREAWIRVQDLAAAGDAAAMFQLATAFRSRREYTQALEWYRRAAEAGHAGAQNDLATMHLNGIGTDSDPVEAVLWYRLAAEQGLPIAQWNLATRYRVGDAVPLDLAEAARWLARSAEQGCMEALGDLGVAHRFGHGVPRDLPRAGELLVAAAMKGDVTAIGNLADVLDELTQLAEQGSRRAQAALGRMYEHGLVVDKDPARAQFWLGKARS